MYSSKKIVLVVSHKEKGKGDPCRLQNHLTLSQLHGEWGINNYSIRILLGFVTSALPVLGGSSIELEHFWGLQKHKRLVSQSSLTLRAFRPLFDGAVPHASIPV
jgi:hypothetical protein